MITIICDFLQTIRNVEAGNHCVIFAKLGLFEILIFLLRMQEPLYLDLLLSYIPYTHFTWRRHCCIDVSLHISTSIVI